MGVSCDAALQNTLSKITCPGEWDMHHPPDWRRSRLSISRQRPARMRIERRETGSVLGPAERTGLRLSRAPHCSAAASAMQLASTIHRASLRRNSSHCPTAYPTSPPNLKRSQSPGIPG